MSNKELCSKCEQHECLDWRKCVSSELQDGRKRMDDLQLQIKTVKDDTSELVEILTAVKGGLKVLGALGRVFKWGSYIAAGVGAILALIHGKWPSN